MVNVVSLVEEIEDDYGGSVTHAPLNDERLIKIRKLLSTNGIDPIVSKKYSFDLEEAQSLLDEAKISKQEIAEKLGVKTYKLHRILGLGVLNDSLWKKNYHQNKAPKFRFFKDGEYITEGTTKEIAHELHVTVNSVRYYRSEKYRRSKNKVRCRLVPVEDDNE